jgi:hypothetical protein
MLLLKAQQLAFRAHKVLAVLGLLGFGLYGETHDLRYGIFGMSAVLMVAWAMAAHPRAATPEAPFLARRWVRWTLTVISVIGVICFLFVAISSSSWRPQAG